jgi:VCBS repeat-containing protein
MRFAGDRSTVRTLKPTRCAMALEPRILFDGAAATAAADHHDNGAKTDAALPAPTTPQAPEAPASAARHLLVVDSRLDNRELLAANTRPGTELLVVDVQQDGLAAIGQALQQGGPVASIDILGHGAPGQFVLGNRTVSADGLASVSAALTGWRGGLTDNADIRLYGCRVGAGEAGRALVDGLARLTQADVAASSDDTGGHTAGGNWSLEVGNGPLDTPSALDTTGLAAWQGLLADAAPTLSLATGSTDALIGGQFSFTVSFTNPSSQPGFAPMVELYLPATGKDGDDGATFVSASYLGQSVVAHVVAFGPDGTLVHPVAKDADGNPLVITASSVGMKAGDQLVVLELPYGSVSQGQPAIDVQVTAQLSNLADTALSDGSPDLTLRARAGFLFGNDALDNPSVDPSRVEPGFHDLVIHPTLVTMDQRIDVTEGETATGPNFGHTQTVTVTPAPGQTLHDVTVTQSIPANVQVTSITPPAGATLASVTLQDGTVLTNPAAIAAAIASDTLFIRAYAVTFATLSGASDVRVGFYVPEADATGNAVVNASTGDSTTIVFGSPSASGLWTPIDPRDVAAPATDIAFTTTGSGQGASFVARSLLLHKTVDLRTDTGQAGLTPGDTLHYELGIDVSDYFAFGQNRFGQGQFTVTDRLGDGQALSGPATLGYTMNGTAHSIAIDVTATVNADGSTTLVFDVGRALQSAPDAFRLGALRGDLSFDDVLSGATRAVISYDAVVAQAYATPYPPHSEINEGDSFGNSASVTATVLADIVNLTGQTESDTSTTTSTIDTREVDIALVTVNGGAPPVTGELRPGDLVTFRLRYDLVTGDYELFRLVAYLPLPLLDLSGVTWTQGTGAGQWTLGAGNTNTDAIDAVSTGPGNAVVFDFGNQTTAANGGSRIEVEFTVRVGDQPFADQRSLDVLAQSDQLTTVDKRHLVSSDVAVIVSVAEPTLDLRHGVVSASHGTVTGTTGTWQPPGAAGVPFQGTVTDIAAVEGSVTGIDGGDTLRLATAIENRGGGGAFDVHTTVTLPPGLGFAGGSLAAANLQVFRGDGTRLVLGTDYSVSGNEVTFLDAGGVATLLAGRPGTPADAAGTNVVVLTYDVTVAADIAAAASLQSTVALTRYASVDGGVDFTPTDPTDTASQQVASPEVRIGFAGGSLDASDSSAAHTAGSDLVIGERMLYDIFVTLPEGSTQSLRLDELVPPGLRLDTSFNGGLGYQLITTVAGSAALTGDFAGSVSVGGFAATSGTLGSDGVGARVTFTAAGATADNQTGNNTFVIRVQLAASNVAGNQANRSLQNNTRLTFSDRDGDTPNGATPVDRDVARTGGQPTVTLREPTLHVTQATQLAPGETVGRGSPLQYLIEIRNGTGSTDVDAFDISFSDSFPSQIDALHLVDVVYQNGATNHGGAGFEIVGQTLRSVAGADIDIPKGGVIVLRVTSSVNSTAASVPSFDNVASVQWTSLDGADAGERTGADGPLDGGALNDYRTSYTLTVPVARQVDLSRVGGLPDTPAAIPTNADSENVAVGELIRYRVVATVAQGSFGDYNLQVTLQNGLGFLNDGTVRIGFITNGSGMSSQTPDLITGGNLGIFGTDDSDAAQPIASDLSGTAPAAVFNMAHATVGTDANGNTVVTFSIGNLINRDNDSDLEFVVMEFNVQVLNQASNVAGVALAASATDRAGSTVLSQSTAIRQTLVEPRFTALDKSVIDFDPNPSGSTGTATVGVSFTQNGGEAAFDVQLRDSFPGGTAYTLVSIELNGTVYGPGNLPAGVTATTTGALSVNFEQLNVGDRVRVVYQATVPNGVAQPASNAVLTWSSLPEDFTSFAGSAIGPDGTPTGERTGSGISPNTYVLGEAAGLGIIQGTLWDDTASANASATPDGPGLAGQAVTLTWAGLDGNLATTADNRVFSTTTDANGQYRFGVLPAGVFRIDTPAGTVPYPQPLGDLRVRIDTDAASPLGQVVVTLGEGATAAADAGYVQRNDAPVNTLPGPQSGLEDVAFALAPLTIADVDAGGGMLQVTLSVLHGQLSLSSTPAGVTATGGGTATLVLTGTLTSLNQALANLVYLGQPNFNGADTLTVLTNDQANTGDVDGNGVPGQVPGDALTDRDTLAINVTPVNDAPAGVDDAATAVEAGGANNRQPGVDPTGNLLGNDTDVDIATNGDRLSLVSIGLQGGGSTPVAAAGITSITGLYGTLHVNAIGGYQYVVDNTNTTVQALRTAGQSLVERFDYTLADLASVTSTATLTVTVLGANDAPVGLDDNGIAVEAGGVGNATAGSDAVGNVLTDAPADRDVDAGDTLTVTLGRFARELAQGLSVPVAPGTTSANGTALAGTYGTLTLGADGSYRYVVDNTNAAVQRLSPGDTLLEYFSYQVTDAAGLSDVAQLRIVVQGAQDNPVASDDAATAQAGSAGINERSPTGNVIRFPSRPGSIDQAGGNGVDNDVDRVDRPNTQLAVNGVRTDNLSPGGALSAVTSGTTSVNGTQVAGAYGTLHIGADGSFLYDVDSSNAAVIALAPGATLTETFTYRITDTSGLSDEALLVVTVHGVNDPPQAGDVPILVREQGGVNNTTPGFDATGDATAFDSDPDGDPIVVTGLFDANGAALPLGQPVAGVYGTLTLNADGTYTYVLDNNNAQVQALRQLGDSRVERFTYEISDGANRFARAELVVVVFGQNDNPVAQDDAAIAVESGGLNDQRTGTDPSGNVLTNDTDVDAFGETRAVSSVRTGTEAGSGTAGTLGTELRGAHGWLTLNDDGSYSYRLDNTDPAVQALRSPSDTLSDSFSYTVADADGAEDRATLAITIRGSNDAPVAVPDTAVAVEAGGVANGTPGTDPTGNVLANDTDVDAFGESLAVSGVRFGLASGQVGSPIAGAYGRLTLNADGSYTYRVDNADPRVEALRTSGQTLTEVFTYTVTDLAGASRQSTLTVVIRGQDDSPVAADDLAIAVEASGIANGIPGTDPTGTLLGNDRDVDANDARLVDGIRTGTEAAGGGFTAVAGTQVLRGQYGTLTVDFLGRYQYVVDNTLPAVDALNPGEVLVDTFTYRMKDIAGASDTAQLQVIVRGQWDTPAARDDFALSVASTTELLGIDPTGDVLANDRDIDDRDSLHVDGIRHGTEAAGGVLVAVDSGTNSSDGTLVNGLYGQLIIGADGAYIYRLDESLPAVRALGELDFLTDTFTYRITDRGGQVDVAQLTVLIRGQNDPPGARNDIALAVEASGQGNAIAGFQPRGNVLLNDSDPESGTLKVVGVRTGTEAGTGTDGTLGTALQGQYGTLRLLADGRWQYTLDNTLPAVEALRTSGQVLVDVFTYTMSDNWRGQDVAELRIVIDGRNDTPVANDDTAVAVEAGGVANGSPGVDPAGNVLGNDTDVDDVARGETKQVVSATNEAGQTALAGAALAGRYGQLTVNADGSYTYVVDNTNPAVQALRTAGETLTETFTYRMRDTAGAVAEARLQVTVQGANDAPVAVDDLATASDQTAAPEASGNVLANDTDPDGGEQRQVVGVRAGTEAAGGTDAAPGTAITGQYGTLHLNADGSYTYEIDRNNPAVLAAAGLGQVLQDVFTYTVADRAGATDQAQLVIRLDIAAPYVAPPDGPHFGVDPGMAGPALAGFELVPGNFVLPTVERVAELTDISDLEFRSGHGIQSQSLGAGLGIVPGQFVARAVFASRAASDLDMDRILNRPGRLGLSVDGLFADPSAFADFPEDLTRGDGPTPDPDPAPPPRTAPGFKAQLQDAARRRPAPGAR